MRNLLSAKNTKEDARQTKKKARARLESDPDGSKRAAKSRGSKKQNKNHKYSL
jgi:hypothetical protein